MTIGLRIGLVLCCLSAGSAQALNHAGVEIAPIVRAEGQPRPWPLLGSAMVHRSFIPFYGLALHGPADAVVRGEIGEGMTPLQITLVWYANDLPKAQVEAHFRELFERVTDVETRERVAPPLQKFIAILPAAKRGTSMVFHYDPDSGTQVSIDGATRGHFAGIEFNRALLSMWLGPKADPAVRDGLTGAPES